MPLFTIIKKMGLFPAYHKLAKILYTMLKERKSFIEVGQAVYEQAYKERQLLSLQKRARELGYGLVAC